MLVDSIVVAQEHLVTHGAMGGGVRHRTTSLLSQRFRRWCRFIFPFVITVVVDNILDDIVNFLIRVRSRRSFREELQDGQVRCFRFQVGDAHT